MPTNNEARKEFCKRIRKQEVPAREIEMMQAKMAVHRYKTRNATETKTKGEER